MATIEAKPLGLRGALLLPLCAIAIAIALPFVLRAFGLDFYLSLASRIVVYAIAATSLNLVLGYAGLVSFGHAAFFGLGAYVTAIMISEGVQSGPLHLAATMGSLSPNPEKLAGSGAPEFDESSDMGEGPAAGRAMYAKKPRKT